MTFLFFLIPPTGYYESTYYNEKPVHKVALDGFYISESPINEKQWFAIMEGILDDSIRANKKSYVDWYDAVSFCNKLSELQGKTPYYTIDTITADTSNHNKNDYKKWTVTCNRAANGFRLPTEAECEYATSFLANVYSTFGISWCFDWYGYYKDAETQINPQGPSSGKFRVYRDLHSSRGSIRYYSFPKSRQTFHIVLPIE